VLPDYWAATDYGQRLNGGITHAAVALAARIMCCWIVQAAHTILSAQKIVSFSSIQNYKKQNKKTIKNNRKF
jgi:hypothetical protein